MALAENHWRIMVMDKHWLPQVTGGTPGSYISVYVDLCEAHHFPTTYHLMAHFQIILHNRDPEKHCKKEAKHAFTKQEFDRGFASMCLLDDLLARDNGWVHKTADGMEHLLIEVSVKDASKPHYSGSSVLKSPKAEGFSAGLKNQGATCYLNSLLQVLYHLSYFREAVYQMPTENEAAAQLQQPQPQPTQPGRQPAKAKSSIPLALQRLFCHMQSSEDNVETKELTASFGWSVEHSWQQHDIQELLRLLSDNLEQKMKGTPAEGTFKQWLGQSQAYIKCVNVAYESKRDDTFYDLQLLVKDCQNIYDSLNKEIAPEKLDGDNKYQAEGHGLQDAMKGVVYCSFPPILFLHLQRFEYDPQHDHMRKINSRYEFFDEITLCPNVQHQKGQKFCANTESEENNYTLFAVLVHSGFAHGGHYYAYIKCTDSTGKKQWLKYDDTTVSKCSLQQATADNFGGKDPLKWWEESKESIRSAYMLLYIKKTLWDKFIYPVPEARIPQHIRTQLSTETEEKKRRQREKEQEHLYLHFRIVTGEDFKAYDKKELHKDLYKFDGHPVEKFKKDTTWRDFIEAISKKTGAKPNCHRLWKWNSRQNSTQRPDNAILQTLRHEPITDNHVLQDIFMATHRATTAHFHMDHRTEPINVFVEVSDPLPKMNVADSALVFFKYYDPKAQSLSYITHKLCPSTAEKVSSFKPWLNELVGRAAASPLDLYEEVRMSMVVPIENDATLKSAELISGDIIIFQPPPGSYDCQLERPTAPEIFHLIQNRVTVRFVPKDTPNAEGVYLQLTTDTLFDQVCRSLAAQINEKADHIRLYPNVFEKYASAPFTPDQRTDVSKMVMQNSLPRQYYPSFRDEPKLLLYEILPIPLAEMETKLQVNLTFFDQKVTTPHDKFTLLLDAQATVKDVIDQVRQKVDEKFRDQPLVVMKMQQASHKIDKLLHPSVKVADLCTSSTQSSGLPLRCDVAPLFSLQIPEQAQEDDSKLESLNLEMEEKRQQSHMLPDRRHKIWASRADGSRLIQVVHMAPELSATPHSDPFLIWVLPNETCQQVHERIRKKLGKKEEDFKRWPLGGASAGSAPQPYQPDDIILEEIKKKERIGMMSFADGDVKLCLIHKDPNKKSYYAGAELKINDK
eukprot:TRINITY_DN67393_c8_g2_i1.p1 TRINITY_DN67393_c8_g2~~TRINITY_DN67393_c8_g2_i1.p1  ORF type:complete len:1213 (+),score=152.20 TRINITY_DN67393_c8_g2_i1:252-3641(+)